MSKTQSLSRQFSPTDFKKLGKLERIAMHLRSPENYHLRDAENDYFSILKRAFAILSENTDQHMRCILISNLSTPPLSDSKVYKIINDTKELFGDVIQVNKKFDRMVLRETFLKLGRLAMEEGDIKEARLSFHYAAKIDDLYSDDIPVFDPNELQLPEINISSRPEAFYADAEIIEEE